MGKLFRKITAFFLAPVFLLLSCPASAAEGERFSDIPNGVWYYDYASFAGENSFFYGTKPSVFSPDEDLTRFQAVTVLGRIHEKITGKELSEQEEKGFFGRLLDWLFTRYYTPYLKWANEMGLFDGEYVIPHGKDSPITREELAVLLYRYVSGTDIEESRKASPKCFYDSEEASPSAEEALREMERYHIFRIVIYDPEYHIIYDDEEKPPLQGFVSRGEGAAILMRLYQRITYPLDKETMRVRFFQADPYERFYWPVSEEGTELITGWEEYERFDHRISPLAFLEDEGELYGKPYRVDEKTFETCNVVAVVTNGGGGEISCETDGDTVTVTCVPYETESSYRYTERAEKRKLIQRGDEKGEFTPFSEGTLWEGYLYLAVVPKTVSQINVQEYSWLEDRFLIPAA